MAVELVRHRLRHRTRPIDVWVAGEGPSLAMLHGWGLNGRAYRGAVLALAEHGYRVVAPSLTVADRWSIATVADFAAEALAGVDAAPAAVVGHSFGGVIGTQLAHDHPSFVSALIAVNSPLVGLGGRQLGRIALPGRHYRIGVYPPAAVALMRAATSPGGMRSLMASTRWFLNNGHEQTLTALAASDIPRAIVWAAADSLLPSQIGIRSAEVLGCDVHMIGADADASGGRAPDHDWPFKQPKEFATTITGILEQLQRRDAPGTDAGASTA